jgi:maleylpyruvate isomerase
MSRLLTLLPVLDQETDRLLATVGGFGDDDVRRPSLLPGWTRGHLLTHLARSGEVLSGLAEGVVSGAPATGYASDEARNAAINAGADRPAPDLAADIAASATAFRAALLAVPDTAAGGLLRLRPGVQFPVDDLPVIRLVELVLHHTDLDAGYTSQDWPAAFTALELTEPQATWRAQRQTATTASA